MGIAGSPRRQVAPPPPANGAGSTPAPITPAGGCILSRSDYLVCSAGMHAVGPMLTVQSQRRTATMCTASASDHPDSPSRLPRLDRHPTTPVGSTAHTAASRLRARRRRLTAHGMTTPSRACPSRRRRPSCTQQDSGRQAQSCQRTRCRARLAIMQGRPSSLVIHGMRTRCHHSCAFLRSMYECCSVL